MGMPDFSVYFITKYFATLSFHFFLLQKLRNRICVGQCISYVVPKEVPSDERKTLDHCEDCRAINSSWATVTLKCRNSTSITKAVEIVRTCVCRLCGPALGLLHKGKSVNNQKFINIKNRRTGVVTTPTPQQQQRTDGHAAEEYDDEEEDIDAAAESSYKDWFAEMSRRFFYQLTGQKVR